MPMPLTEAEELNFADSYLSSLNPLQAGELDADLDSYMASGHDVGDGITGAQRDTIIEDTLNNINTELASLNSLSSGEARSQQREHDAFFDSEILPVFNRAREYSRKKTEDTAFEQSDHAGMSFQRIRSFFHRKRKEKAERLLEDLVYDPAGKLISGDDNLRKQLLDKSEKWNQKRQQYHDGKFRSISEKFDSLAETYYALSRNKQNLRESMQTKEVEEYAGKYDDGALTGYITQIDANPYVPPLSSNDYITHDDVKAGSLTQNSFMDPNGPYRHFKVHRTISMQAKPGEASNRIKVTYTKDRNGIGTFSAYRAKKKYGADGALIDDPDLDPNSRALSAQDMDDLLEINAKDRQGRYLYSSESARIMKATIGGVDAHALYLRSSLVTDSDSSHGAFKPELSEKKMKEESELRSAIRRSAFFQHVNSKTIQQYAAYQYNSSDRFGTDLHQGIYDSIRPDLDQAGHETGPAKDVLIHNLITNDQNSQTSIAHYLAQGRDITTIYNHILPSLKTMSSDKKRIITLCEYLLTDDSNPKAWDLAKKIVVDTYVPISNSIIGSRFTSRLKRLPASGQLMRMGLLEELETDRSFTLDNIMNSATDTIMPGSYNVYKEDLMAQRGNILTDLKQGFFNGSLISFGASATSSVFFDVKSSSKNRDWAEFATIYADAASEASGFGIVLETLPGFLLLTGNKDEEGISDSARTGNAVITTLNAVKVLVKSCYQAYKRIKERIEKPEKKFNAKDLYHCFFSLIHVLKVLYSAVSSWLENMYIPDTVVEIVSSFIEFIKEVIDAILADKFIRKTDQSIKDIETAISYSKTPQGIGPLSEEDQRRRDLGNAASQNSQAQFFLSMARSNAAKSKTRSIVSSIGNAINSIGSVIAVTGLGAHVGFSIKAVSKASNIANYFIGKGYERSTLKDNIQKMLGDKKYLGYHNFDGILKQETGIKNHHYLNDVARIFTAIDMHHMVKSTDSNDTGRTALALASAGTLLSIGSGSDAQRLQKLQRLPLEKFLAVMGGPAADWRMVLKNAIF